MKDRKFNLEKITEILKEIILISFMVVMILFIVSKFTTIPSIILYGMFVFIFAMIAYIGISIIVMAFRELIWKHTKK